MMCLQTSFTLPAAPEKISACEKCVYGGKEHAPWCLERKLVVSSANGCSILR
jgi:hypothetical protein